MGDLPDERVWDWVEDAACRGQSLDLFFSQEGSHSPGLRSREIRQAKEFCMRCPVQRQCRRYALTAPEPYGVWGGMTSFERAKVRREMKIVA